MQGTGGRQHELEGDIPGAPVACFMGQHIGQRVRAQARALRQIDSRTQKARQHGRIQPGHGVDAHAPAEGGAALCLAAPISQTAPASPGRERSGPAGAGAEGTGTALPGPEAAACCAPPLSAGAAGSAACRTAAVGSGMDNGAGLSCTGTAKLTGSARRTARISQASRKNRADSAARAKCRSTSSAAMSAHVQGSMPSTA